MSVLLTVSPYGMVKMHRCVGRTYCRVVDPERQVTVARATKFLKWRRVILSLARNLLHVSNLAPSMSRWLLGLWKIYAPVTYGFTLQGRRRRWLKSYENVVNSYQTIQRHIPQQSTIRRLRGFYNHFLAKIIISFCKKKNLFGWHTFQQ